MANRFISILQNAGHLFTVGWQKALAFESQPKVKAVENAALAAVSLVDPALGVTLTSLFGIFVRVEQVSTAVGASSGTGPQKLQAALPDFEAAILSLPMFAGKRIPDLTQFNRALIQSASGLVDLMNAFETDNPVDAPAVPPVVVPIPQPLVVAQAGKA